MGYVCGWRESVVGEHFNAIAATVASHAWKRPKKRSSSSQGIGLAQHGPILEHIVHADGAIPVEVTDLDRASERLLRTLAGDDLDELLDHEIQAAYQRDQAATNDDAAPTPAPSDGAEESSSSDSSSDEEISSDSDSDDDYDPMA